MRQTPAKPAVGMVAMFCCGGVWRGAGRGAADLPAVAQVPAVRGGGDPRPAQLAPRRAALRRECNLAFGRHEEET